MNSPWYEFSKYKTGMKRQDEKYNKNGYKNNIVNGGKYYGWIWIWWTWLR